YVVCSVIVHLTTMFGVDVYSLWVLQEHWYGIAGLIFSIFPVQENSHFCHTGSDGSELAHRTDWSSLGQHRSGSRERRATDGYSEHRQKNPVFSQTAGSDAERAGAGSGACGLADLDDRERQERNFCHAPGHDRQGAE